MTLHPSEAICGTKSLSLKDKRILLCITGSIAAVKCVELARELIRHGAEVTVIMSAAAAEIITPESLEFATGKKVITKIEGAVEHVSLVEGPCKVDLILVAPASANTISKIANGIADNAVTLMLASALGARIPMILVPSMHASLYDNPVIQENLKKLATLGIGIQILMPPLSEGAIKFLPIDEIVAFTIRRIGKNDLRDKNILVITGSSEEAIDDVRILTNRSTGKTGIEIAKQSFYRGANVELWYGKVSEQIPKYIPSLHFTSISDLAYKISYRLSTLDYIFVPAALSDYTVDSYPGKISSELPEITLKLKKTPKIIKLLSEKGKVIPWKAESKIEVPELIERAHSKLMEINGTLIIANLIEDVTEDVSRIFIVYRDKNYEELVGTREEIAERILDVAVTTL